MTMPGKTRAPRGKPSPVLLSEEDGVRMLHLGGEAIQSAMRVDAPHVLGLEYTRCMLTPLLFRPAPRSLLLIGLGGGSQAKFLHRHLPAARLAVVEINAQVVAAARSFFFLPKDGRRFRVIVDDGARHVATTRARHDLILLDGFENYRQAPTLTSPAFYGHLRAALTETGILAINFMGNDRHLRSYVNRLDAVFEGKLLALRARGEGNVVVLGFRRVPVIADERAMMDRAERLERRFNLPFRRYLSSLRPVKHFLRPVRGT
jgi:spermidine synthase